MKKNVSSSVLVCAVTFVLLVAGVPIAVADPMTDSTDTSITDKPVAEPLANSTDESSTSDPSPDSDPADEEAAVPPSNSVEEPVVRDKDVPPVGSTSAGESSVRDEDAPPIALIPTAPESEDTTMPRLPHDAIEIPSEPATIGRPEQAMSAAAVPPRETAPVVSSLPPGFTKSQNELRYANRTTGTAFVEIRRDGDLSEIVEVASGTSVMLPKCETAQHTCNYRAFLDNGDLDAQFVLTGRGEPIADKVISSPVATGDGYGRDWRTIGDELYYTNSTGHEQTLLYSLGTTLENVAVPAGATIPLPGCRSDTTCVYSAGIPLPDGSMPSPEAILKSEHGQITHLVSDLGEGFSAGPAGPLFTNTRPVRVTVTFAPEGEVEAFWTVYADDTVTLPECHSSFLYCEYVVFAPGGLGQDQSTVRTVLINVSGIVNEPIDPPVITNPNPNPGPTTKPRPPVKPAKPTEPAPAKKETVGSFLDGLSRGAAIATLFYNYAKIAEVEMTPDLRKSLKILDFFLAFTELAQSHGSSDRSRVVMAWAGVAKAVAAGAPLASLAVGFADWALPTTTADQDALLNHVAGCKFGADRFGDLESGQMDEIMERYSGALGPLRISDDNILAKVGWCPWGF